MTFCGLIMSVICLEFNDQFCYTTPNQERNSLNRLPAYSPMDFNSTNWQKHHFHVDLEEPQ